MTVFDPIFSVLNALPGMSGRVFHAQSLKTASPPFIFWLQASEEYHQAMEGYINLVDTSIEVHVVAANFTTLEDLYASAKNAVIAMQGTTSGGFTYQRINLAMTSPLIHEREVGMYRKVFEVNITYTVPELSTEETNEEE